MRRVCKPDGVVAARDSDYAAMTWYPPSAELDRWLELYHAITATNRAEADAGRRLRGVGPRRRLFRRPVLRVGMVLRHARRARLVGRSLGRPRHELTVRRAGRCSQPLRTRRAREIAEAFRAWARDDDAWFAVLHGEILGTP